MDKVVISGTGLWHPEESITNEELVQAYNGYAAKFNETNADKIAAGEIEEKLFSSAEFIEKASGIKQRYTYRREGILDVERMRPKIPARADNELSHQGEMAVRAARLALDDANKSPDDIDMVFCVVDQCRTQCEPKSTVLLEVLRRAVLHPTKSVPVNASIAVWKSCQLYL